MILAGGGVALSAIPLRIGGFDPAFLWVAGVLVVVVGAVRGARREGLDPRDMYWTAACAIVAGLWAGRAVSVAMSGGDVAPLAWLLPSSGARSSFGGFAGAALACTAYVRARRGSLLAVTDAAAVPAMLGYAVARLGCLVNGDDFGAPSALPWAVRHAAGTLAHADHVARGLVAPYASWSASVHPWPLYSAVAALAIAALVQGRRGAGERTACMMLAYGVARALLEPLRGDAPAVAGPLSANQLCALALAAGGAALLHHARRDAQRKAVVAREPAHAT